MISAMRIVCQCFGESDNVKTLHSRYMLCALTAQCRMDAEVQEDAAMFLYSVFQLVCVAPYQITP